jgi:DNA-binding transcriptional LysR family regulator
MFDWNDARYFLAIARQRSLSAAGRQLNVQQSTMGRRLAALEEALDARLFDRTPDGYLLSPAGEVLFARAERMEDEVLSAERELLGRERKVAGTVRMTAPQAFGNDFVVPQLARLHAEQPEVVVELVADNANLSLTKREADLALRMGRPQQPLLVARRLAEVMNGLYASRTYLARHGRPKGQDLSGHDFVGFDESYLHRQSLGWFAQRARGGRCTIRLNGSHGIVQAVAAHMGVGPLPCWLADSRPDLERVLPAEGFAQELWLVLHRDLRHVARIRAVAEFFVREMRAAAPVLRGEPSPRRKRTSA